MASALISALIAHALSPTLVHTTYGYGEAYCGDPHEPRTCDAAATTASGLPFHPDEPHVALHVPASVTERVRIRPGRWSVCFRHTQTGEPVRLPITDKKGNPGGFDLSPGALRLLGITPSPTWSGTLMTC